MLPAAALALAVLTVSGVGAFLGVVGADGVARVVPGGAPARSGVTPRLEPPTTQARAAPSTNTNNTLTIRPPQEAPTTKYHLPHPHRRHHRRRQHPQHHPHHPANDVTRKDSNQDTDAFP